MQVNVDSACLVGVPYNCALYISYRWALEQGATSQVTPALFPLGGGSSSSSSNSTTADNSSSSMPSLRGCAAATNLDAGSVMMGVPMQLLITYDTAAKSDFGKALSRLPGKNLLVLYTQGLFCVCPWCASLRQQLTLMSYVEEDLCAFDCSTYTIRVTCASSRCLCIGPHFKHCVDLGPLRVSVGCH